MFTGIITEIGGVKSVAKKGSSSRLEVICAKAGEGLGLGDSVAVNGACLSIVEKKKDSLVFDVVDNTFSKTNLKRIKIGDKVHLEKALKMGDTLSGHMVSGHVDEERKIKNNKKTSKGWMLDIGLLPGDETHLVSKGSIAIDGVSLTIGELSRNFLRIFLIPHTLENTMLEIRKIGDYVNVEFDMMGKYADRRKSKSTITENMLRKNGFMR